MCSSLSAVMMYFSSGESKKVVRRDVWPRIRVPFEAEGWETREVRSRSSPFEVSAFETGEIKWIARGIIEHKN